MKNRGYFTHYCYWVLDKPCAGNKAKPTLNEYMATYEGGYIDI